LIFLNEKYIGHRWSRFYWIEPRGRVVETRPSSNGPRQFRDRKDRQPVAPVGEISRFAHPAGGRYPQYSGLQKSDKRHRFCIPRGGIRLRASLHQRPRDEQRSQRVGLPQHAGRLSRCRGETIYLCCQFFHLWRQPLASQGRRGYWQAPFSLRHYQVRERALCRCVLPHLRDGMHRATLFQRVWTEARPQRRVRRGDPLVREATDATRVARHQWRRRVQPRLHLYR